MSKVLIPVLVIIFGVMMLLRNIFGWNISFFRVLVGVIIVALGISLLTGGARWFRDGFSQRSGAESQYQGSPASANQEIVFSQRHFTATGSAKFSYIFSSGTVDLTTLPAGQHHIQVTCALGRISRSTAAPRSAVCKRPAATASTSAASAEAAANPRSRAAPCSAG